MSFNANDREGGGTPFEAIEAGTYPGRLVQLITMGLQPSRPYQGVAKPPQERMSTTYEFSHLFMKDEDGNDDPEKPRWISEDFPFYNLEADRAKSTLRYNALDPSGAVNGDWSKLLSVPCNITVSKEPRKGKEGQFTNYITHVASASDLPGYTQPELVNPTRVFDIEEPDMEVFKILPEWLQKKLTTNLNYNGSALQKALGETETATEVVADAPAPAAPPMPQTAPPMPPPAPTSVS